MPGIPRTKEELEFDLTTQTKKCTRCSERKSFNDFYNHNRKNIPDKKSYWCKSCMDSKKKEWKSKNKQTESPRARNYRLKNKYGITQEDYLRMLGDQNNICAICGSTAHKGLRKNERLFVDHNHKTNKVRGLLCDHCNRALGYFDDNIDNLKAAIKYLEKHQNEQ